MDRSSTTRGLRALALDRTTASILLDRELRVAWGSPASGLLLGRDPEDLLGRSALELVHPDDVERAASLLADAVDPGAWSGIMDDHLAPELRVLRGDGRALWVRCRATNLMDQPDVAGILVHLDHHEVAHHRDRVIALLAAGAPVGDVVGAVLDLLGAQAPQGVPGIWRGRPEARLEVPAGCSLPPAAVHELVRGAPARATFVVPACEPDARPWWVVPARAGDGRLLATVVVRCEHGLAPTELVAQDLDGTASLLALCLDRLEREARLRRDAEHDGLTGLPNRRQFDRAVAAAAEGPGSWAVVYVDLDRFKPVNDTHGHAAGDQVLRSVAHRLRRCVRPDDVVARIGGDEFAVVLGSVSAGDLDRLAARIRAAVEQPVLLTGTPVTVGCSLGIGRGTRGVAPATVLADADRDLYERKARGRDLRP